MSTRSPYDRFCDEDLMLRDELAMDRTVLANERTFLAYVRTAVALLLVGITFVHFSNTAWLSAVGVISVIVGAVTMLLGLIRYRRMRRLLAAARRRADRGAGDVTAPRADNQQTREDER